MSATNPRRNPGGDLEKLAWYTVGAALLAATVIVNTAVRTTATGPVPSRPQDWLYLPVQVATGTVPWPEGATAVAIATAVGLLAVAVGVWLLRRRRKPRLAIDAAAPHLATRRELARLTRAGVTATHRRLGIAHVPGWPVGDAIGGPELFTDAESSEVDIWGSRMGKTTSRAIPVLLAAPGAAIATTNRRDLVDDTRDVRARAGPVRVFDPQGIIGEHPDWHFDPGLYIRSGPQGSEVKAAALAEIFAGCAAKPNSKEDAFFDPEGTEVTGHLLHAAALDWRPVTAAYDWVVEPTDKTPRDILTAHGFDRAAQALLKASKAPDKQREGVYGAAKRRLAFLTYNSALPWITPGPGRQLFDPDEFVAGGGTLYLVSREGTGSMAALTTALTAAVLEAAETLAGRSSRGRMPIPFTAVLDEAANVCKLASLPALYSHYAGRGIFLLTILQSWAQGVRVWGRDGMETLWSAALIRIYGGGVAEVEVLSQWARMGGEYRYLQTSSSSSHGRRTVSTSVVKEEVLNVRDLAGMPKERGIAFISGMPPVLIEPRPWHKTKWAKAVDASHARHDPSPTAEPADRRRRFARVRPADRRGAPPPAPPTPDVDSRQEMLDRWSGSV